MNKHPCVVRPTLRDLNPVELLYYLFITGLARCDRICNTFKSPFCTICLPIKK